MRRIFILLILVIPVQLFGNHQFQIINKGQRQGLANNEGEELIPPIYDKIGWSKGEIELVGDLIGYKLNGSWGLITVKNKIITNPNNVIIRAKINLNEFMKLD